MARILVTGGVGFVGSHLLRRLVSRGDEVRVLDVVSPDQQPKVAAILGGLTFQYLQGDVRDAGAVAGGLRNVDAVYHLASHVGIDHYLDDPVEVADVVVTGTRIMAQEAIRAEVPMTFVSTSEVYGRNPQVPWSEEADCVIGDPSRPRWVYACAKILAEHILFGLGRKHGLPFSTVRLFNLYGPGQDSGFFVTRTLWRLTHGLAPVIYAGGNQQRCFTWVDDAVDGLLIAAEHPAGRQQAFNIGNDKPTTVLEAIEILARVAGRDPATLECEHRTWDEVYGPGYDEPVVRIPNVTKAKTHLGWGPSTPLSAGAGQMLAWAEAHGWWTSDQRRVN